jgi:hypothetical protein
MQEHRTKKKMNRKHTGSRVNKWSKATSIATGTLKLGGIVVVLALAAEAVVERYRKRKMKVDVVKHEWALGLFDKLIKLRDLRNACDALYESSFKLYDELNLETELYLDICSVSDEIYEEIQEKLYIIFELFISSNPSGDVLIETESFCKDTEARIVEYQNIVNNHRETSAWT